MRLTMLFLFCFAMTVSASIYSQNTKLDLHLERATVREIFDFVEQNSQFIFLYKNEDINVDKKLDMNLKNAGIDEIMQKILDGQNASYRVFNRQVVITKSSDLPHSFSGMQQNTELKGVVLDQNALPLPGVSVMVKGTTIGITTDVDGKFQLTVPADATSLVFSFVGMKMQELAIGSKSFFTIVMEEETQGLEDVVVVAFGQQKKASVVASIESVKPKDLRVPSSNLTTALAGRVSGVIAYQRSGEPGQDNAEFFVRGVTTFGYAQKPLILLDGFEVSSTDLAAVEPDNIEQFVILKDATAAALYGSKGANGVISVTTKQGVEGAPKISFRHESRISTPTQIPQTVDGVSYMKLYNQAQNNDNPLLAPYYSSQKIFNTENNLNPYAYPNLNWYDEMFKDHTYNQHYTLNASGGGKVVRYYLASTYAKETGILRDNKLNNFKNNIDIDRINLLAKVNINLSKSTTLEINMNSVFENYNGPARSATAIFNDVMDGNPVEFPKLFAPTEEFSNVRQTLFGINSGGTMVNPYAKMVSGYKDGFENTVISQFLMVQKLDKLTKGLQARAKASIRTQDDYKITRSYAPYYYSLKNYDELSDSYEIQEIVKGDESLGDPVINQMVTSKFYGEIGFDYARTFNDKHEVGAVLLYTQEETKNMAKKSNTTGTIQLTLPSRNQGVRGRVNYAYDSRYMIEGSLTFNGSEKFDQAHRWGLFPAMGVGYMISNENYWKPVSHVIPKFKLKYSFGKVGNDDIAKAEDRFFFLSDITTSSSGYRWGQDFTNDYGSFSINRYANPEIKWEIAVKQNMGIEMNLFNLFNIQAEYFTERREDIYQSRKYLPASLGLSSSVYGNVGEASSKGIDGSLDFNHSFNQNFWITGRFNFTYAKSKIIENEEPEYKDEYLKQKGFPIRQPWGYIAERLFIDDADVTNSPAQEIGGIVRAGDIKYKDINRDGIVNSNDRVPIGFPTTPEVNYGFGLSAGYKAFDISFFFQGQGRTSFFIDPSKIAPFIGQRNALQYIADNHWSPNNPVSNTFWPRLSASDNDNNYEKYSTWWLRNGSLLRLKTLEVGYTLPKSALKSLHLKSARLYFSGSNLLRFSKFDLWDPEMGDNGLGYPLQQVYSVGVNITF